MANKKTVVEHLKNEALWAPERSQAVGEEWKRLLVDRFAPQRRMAIKMRDELRPWLVATVVAIPLLAVAVAAALYFGLISPAVLSEGMQAAFSWKIPGTGLPGGILFAVLVNLVTFLIKDDLLELF